MSSIDEIKSLRHEYSKRELDEKSVAADPIEQFTRWFQEISKTSTAEVNAMALATADATGRPSVRMVLLKEYDAGGFLFYTNYQSQKGSDLQANPKAALLFYWDDLERQIRIEGAVERLSVEKNREYFASRPLGAQLGAIISDQSRPLPSRDELDEKMTQAERASAGKAAQCPPHWGGYRLIPSRFEFWQGRENRLHDRICYDGSPQTTWKISRLYP